MREKSSDKLESLCTVAHMHLKISVIYLFYISNFAAFIVREREDENGVKKSKGYGFISFEDPKAAEEAINAMHQSVRVLKYLWQALLKTVFLYA